MGEYTLKQRLQQLALAPTGSTTKPEFIWEHDGGMNWAEPLRQLAWDALREIERLEKEDMLTLRISKQGKEFVVDDPKLTGSPPCGYGRTMVSAVGAFFHVNQSRLGIKFEVDDSALKTEMRRRKRELAKR